MRINITNAAPIKYYIFVVQEINQWTTKEQTKRMK